jgi:hypothetical protein
LLALCIPLHCETPLGLDPRYNRAVTGQTRKTREWFHPGGANRFAASEIDKLPALHARKGPFRPARR